MQNKGNNKEKGDLGESIACKYLIKKGFEIIERNYWQKCGEIDIIAKNKGIIHFVEVKSVSKEIKTDSVTYETNDYYRPEDNLHTWKLGRLRKTIQVYLAEKSVTLAPGRAGGQADETNWQFDVITVYFDEKRLISRVFMLENVIL